MDAAISGDFITLDQRSGLGNSAATNDATLDITTQVFLTSERCSQQDRKCPPYAIKRIVLADSPHERLCNAIVIIAGGCMWGLSKNENIRGLGICLTFVSVFTFALRTCYNDFCCRKPVSDF